jgi:hypothetical protein
MTQILKRSFVELGFYCQKCGHELEAGVAMSTSAYNEARVEIEPCAACEKLRSKVETALKIAAPATEQAIKRRGRPPKINLEPTRKTHKRIGRPPKNQKPDAPPAETIKKKRGRPPKIKPIEE